MPFALQPIVNRERDLGGRVGDAKVRGDRDDALVVPGATAGEERQALCRVGRGAKSVDDVIGRLARHEEAMLSRFGRQVDERTGASPGGLTRWRCGPSRPIHP